MGLRIPPVEVQHVAATVGPRSVVLRVRLAVASEGLAPALLEVQAERRVDRVTGLVSQDAHARGRRSALDLQHLSGFQLHQPRVGEEERDGDTRHPVRREPLGRQPAVRLEADSAGRELVVESGDPRLEGGSLDLDAEITDTTLEELLVGVVHPVRLGATPERTPSVGRPSLSAGTRHRARQDRISVGRRRPRKNRGGGQTASPLASQLPGRVRGG